MTQNGTCARNLPQHFNGCTCTAAPGGTLLEATVVDLPGAERPYVLLSEPEVVVLPDGTEVTNYLAEPTSDEDGIFAYGSTTPPDPWSSVKDEMPGIPGKAYSFTGSVHSRDGARLLHVRGRARSHGEACDRSGAPKGPWADKYDQRPSTLRYTADEQTRAAIARNDEETARRLGAADELNDAIAERKRLRGLPILPTRRRKVAESNARIEAAWAAYREAYPYAKPQNNL